MMERVGLLGPARAALLGVAFACVALACDQRASEGVTVTPTDHSGDSGLKPEGEFEGESINELEVRLQRLGAKQDQLVTAGSTDAGKCEELCQLSRAICEIKTKMCEIADEHVADDAYQNLCRQAKQRCQRASESCHRCVQHHERTNQSSSSTPRAASCEGEPITR